MRGILSCYNEHAISVSDSHSSKHNNPSTPHTITCIYKLNLFSNQTQFLITITWTKKLIHQGFTININPSDSDSDSSNSHQFRKNKGIETIQHHNFEVQVLWDISDAKYYEGSEPVEGFYLILLVNSELGLRLGDKDEEWLKNKKVTGDFSLVSKSELFYNTNVYATKSKFCDTGISHDIVIKFDIVEEELSKSYSHHQNHRYSYNHNNYVLCVCMDNRTIFEVKRLRWNFRGNQTIFVDGLVIDVMWDLHDCLFNQNKGSAMFMFRTRSGLDCRLWLEKNLRIDNEFQDKEIGFSLLICSNCKNPD
ncbi:hypothetical protein TanjilG_02587 [Lupinus angustifolius]|uniref:DUF868 domain-containing protein n=1 Tax=Lupinus angustifolius TaxID=3871 RepID=A0A4P1R9B4_LUPAN|nr:PREDICTED: uncharacterized protein LOC109356414 [Lupinus angustifolius]OIW05114.1 hypothetical protein TanjilG_02587 [Lupinus angustifolius]